MRVVLLGTLVVFGLTPPTMGQSLSLSLAVQTALRHHPAIQGALRAVDRDSRIVEVSTAATWPQIEGTAGYDRSTANFAATPGSLPTSLLSSAGSGATHDSANSFSAYLTIQQLVYDFGKTPSALHTDEAQVDIARLELLQTRATVVYEVTQAYYQALQAQELLNVHRQTQEQHEEHLTQAREFFRVGSRPKFDVLKAEVDKANSQVNLLKAENAVKNSRRKLQFTMGLRETVDAALDDRVLTPTPFSYHLEALIQRALSRRPDLLTIRAQVRLAELQKTAAANGDAPSLHAGGSYSLQGQAFPLTWNWSVGLNFTWPMFTGHAADAAAARAESALLIAKAKEEELTQSALLEIDQHFNDMGSAHERIKATDKLIEQAQDQLTLAENRYTTGVGSPVEVTDAQVALTNAKTSRVQALVEYKLSETKLLKSIGALAPEETPKP